jgi:hypothetical protein
MIRQIPKSQAVGLLVNSLEPHYKVVLFLDFIDHQKPATLKTKARALTDKGKDSDGWTFNSVLEFMQFQKNERYNYFEISVV